MPNRLDEYLARPSIHPPLDRVSKFWLHHEPLAVGEFDVSHRTGLCEDGVDRVGIVGKDNNPLISR